MESLHLICLRRRKRRGWQRSSGRRRNVSGKGEHLATFLSALVGIDTWRKYL
jgi:hypothetical protein